MIQKQVCITGDLPCGNPEINWIIPNSSCMASPCEGCDDMCIDLTMDEECTDKCVQVVITCPECSVCETITRTFCLCEGESDCTECEDCDDSICVAKCENFCDEYGACVNCLDDAHCQGDYRCIQGECQCPPGTDDLGNGVCRECLVDDDCDECEVCLGIKCVEKLCPGGVCVGDDCVECENSGHCGQNEVCVEDNTCECAPGFFRDPVTQECVPVYDCEDPTDCGSCKECVGGNCVDKVCPSGYTCFEDECVKLCNCANPICDSEGYECVNLGFGKCVCLPCEECENPDVPGTGTDPDPDNPNNPGTPCSKNGDCAPGSECYNGGCVDCDNCTEDSCVEVFEINKDDDSCKVEGVLETSNKCNCDILTWTSEVFSRNSSGVSFRLRLREGNAFLYGVPSTTLLRNLDIDNVYPIQGDVEIKVQHKGFYLNTPSNSWTKTKELQTLSFEGTDEILTYPIRIYKPGTVCMDSDSGETVQVTSAQVLFKISPEALVFENNCEYSIEETTLTYVINESGGQGFYNGNDFLETVDPFLQYTTLQSLRSKNPLFSWYKSTTYLETGGTLIRKAYADKFSSTVYRDAWIDVEPQHYYRLESSCSCSEKTYYLCDDEPNKLYFCNPDISTIQYNLTDCNKSIEFLGSNVFGVCFANASYPQVYELYLNEQIVDEFTPIGSNLTISGSYTTQTPITSIKFRLKGLECEHCYEEIIPSSGSLDVDFDSYDCTKDELSISISGGSGTYSVEIDNNPWPIGDPIDLVTGVHTIYVEDDITGCTFSGDFEVDCCAIFSLNSPDAETCTQYVGNYQFSVSGGESDYVWTVYDEPQGTLLDSGTSSTENITADLSAYDGASFYIEVEDNKQCQKSDTVFVMYKPPVNVSFNNVEYCAGDVTHDITVQVLSGDLDIAYDLKQSSSSLATGTISSSVQNITVPITGNDSYTLELTDNSGCFLAKPLTLVEDSCPNPVINIDSETTTVCEGFDLIITAEITSGTPPFMWEVRDSITTALVGSGSGSNIHVNTNLDYSVSDGAYDFDIHVEDSKGKTADTTQEYTVLDDSDPECINCPPEPNIELASDVGWNVEPDDAVEITHNQGGALSQKWYVNGVFTGFTGTSFYPDTSSAGAYNIYAEIEYAQYCFVNSEVETLTVSEPCDCEYGITLTSGWGSDTNQTITSNTTSSETGCVPQAITAAVSKSSCSGSETVQWKLYRSSSEVDSGTGNSFNYNITTSGTYRLEVYGSDGSCVVPAVSFTKTFQVCRTCEINSDPISNESICDGQSVSKTLIVHDSWEAAPVKFVTTVNGSSYGTSPDKCAGNTECTHSQTFSGLSVGTHNIIMKAYEYDEVSCSTQQSFTIEVRAINDPACQDCGDNTATITVTGQTGCSGSTCTINATEGQNVNLSASATGTPGGFTYQWSNSGGNIGSGQSSVTVGPFNYGQSPSYTITATDSEGCEFTKNIVINVSRDCSGAISTSQSENSACQGESVSLSWNLTDLYNYTEYTVELYRSLTGVGGPYQLVQSGLLWNATYNLSMPNSSYHWYIRAKRGTGLSSCIKQSSTRSISLDSCVDCTGVVNSVSASQNPLCVGGTTNLTANISGDTSGWTYTWSDSSGTIGTGTTLNGYSPSSLPVTVTVTYAKSGCTGGSKQITLTEASTCCNLGINPSTGSGEICPTGSIGLVANTSGNTSGWSFVWRKGTSPSGEIIGSSANVTYNNITGTTVTLRATKTGCTPLEATLNFSYSSSCCDGEVTAVSASDQTVCVNDTINLSATTNGSGSGWTYQWKHGSTNIGPPGLSISNYTLTTLPQTLTLHYTNDKCPTGSGTKSVVISQAAECCAGTVSITGNTQLCAGESTTLNNYTYPLGRTTTWRRGTSPSGPVLGTGNTLSNYTPPSLPETIRLWGTRDGCSPVYDEVTLTEVNCCPEGITLTQLCGTSNMQIRVNNLTSEDKVQFNGGTVLTAPHPSGTRTYTWSGTGITTVEVYVFRDNCPLVGDNTTFNLTLIR